MTKWTAEDAVIVINKKFRPFVRMMSTLAAFTSRDSVLLQECDWPDLYLLARWFELMKDCLDKDVLESGQVDEKARMMLDELVSLSFKRWFEREQQELYGDRNA